MFQIKIRHDGLLDLVLQQQGPQYFDGLEPAKENSLHMALKVRTPITQISGHQTNQGGLLHFPPEKIRFQYKYLKSTLK